MAMKHYYLSSINHASHLYCGTVHHKLIQCIPHMETLIKVGVQYVVFQEFCFLNIKPPLIPRQVNRHMLFDV